MEVSYCGNKLEMNTIKVGDKYALCDCQYSMSNDPYPNRERFAVAYVVSVDLEKETVTFDNGQVFTNAYTTIYPYAGYKIVDWRGYLKTKSRINSKSKFCIWEKEGETLFYHRGVRGGNVLEPYFAIPWDNEFDAKVLGIRLYNEQEAQRLDKDNYVYENMQKPMQEKMAPLDAKLNELMQKVEKEKSRLFFEFYCSKCTRVDYCDHYHNKRAPWNYQCSSIDLKEEY